MAPDDPRTVNRFALWSLFATALLAFPVAAVLAVVGLFQISRSRGRETGALFATLALVVSVVLAPAAVLAALHGRPRAFDQCYYIQEKAVGVLRLISYLEEKHHEETGRYGSLAEIGFKPRVSTRPYTYEVERYDASHFLAVARGAAPLEGDLLTVDESKHVQRVQNVCSDRLRAAGLEVE